MVRIRLRRVGGKKQASFRLVAADKESPRDGRFIEILGFYNPRTEPATIDLKEDRIYDWMSKGAQPSDSAHQIFKTIGLMDRYERFKGGEKVEALMAEALEAKEARQVNPKTRYPAPVGQPKKPKVEEAVEEAAPEAEVEEAPEAKAETAGEEKAEAPAEDSKQEVEEVAEEESKADEPAEDQAEEPVEESAEESSEEAGE